MDAVTDDRSRVRVVATLRADFYDRPLQHRGFGELLRDGTEVITPMSPLELERAITGPGGAVRHHVRAGARGRAGEGGRGPHRRVCRCCSTRLTELFERRRGGRISYAAYEELGGVSGALVKRADGLLAGLGDEAHDVTRQVLLRLVNFGEGGEDTRRRVLQSELEQLTIDRRMLALRARRRSVATAC